MFTTPIFSSDRRIYTSLDVLLCAAVRGELSRIEQTLAENEACRVWAEAEGHELDDRMLQAASEAYRKQMGLTTAEGTQAWLNARGVTLDDFVDYLERSLWRQRLQGDYAALRAKFGPDEDRINDLIWPEIVFSGALDPLSMALARRVAVGEEEKAQGHAPDPQERVPREVADWTKQLGVLEEAAAEFVALDAAYARQVNGLLNPDRIGRELEHRRLEFLRVRVESLLFSDENVANEAYWCVTQEGESLETFCAVTSIAARCYSALLADLPEGLRRQFLSGAPGQVFEPVRTEDGFVIFQLHHKVEPDPADSETRRRLERDITSKYFDGLIQKHLQWLYA